MYPASAAWLVELVGVVGPVGVVGVEAIFEKATGCICQNPRSTRVPSDTSPINSPVPFCPPHSGVLALFRTRPGVRACCPNAPPMMQENTVLRTSDLDYCLPPDRIAIRPARPRDSARLLVVSRSDPSVIVHAHARDLPDFLACGDRMVCNTTRVLPARFRGQRADTGGKVQGLYLSDATQADGLCWTAMIKSRRHQPGMVIRLFDKHQAPSPYTLRLLERVDDPAGAWRVQVQIQADASPSTSSQSLCDSGSSTTARVLESVGLPPLPPYILAARAARDQRELDPHDQDSYQTVYAQLDNPGSVAAPTAGLHFTPDLLDRLAQRGITRSSVVLDVGAGTFKPVEAETVESHPIHQE